MSRIVRVAGAIIGALVGFGLAALGGGRYLDRQLDVAITHALQTVAGRMVFALPRLD